MTTRARTPDGLGRSQRPPLRVPPSADVVHASILGLVDRFRPEEAGDLRAAWLLEVTGQQAYTLTVRGGALRVAPGRGRYDATLSMDASTWVDLVDGRETGVSAFLGGRLRARGDLNLAIRLETLLRPGPHATRMLSTVRTSVGGFDVESLVGGHGTPVLLLHGLAANKVSFLPTLDGLADHYEVHALDLPGFGRSDKPLPTGRRYSPAWMADVVRSYLRANDLRDAYLVGNSMGGRIAIETAMRHPNVVRGTVGLGSAVAFDEWQWAARIVGLLRGQWVGVLPFAVRRRWLEAAMADMFHDPTSLPVSNIAAGVDDFLRAARDPRYRLAIVACMRYLARERATGRANFWTRLEQVQVPTYWIWGRHDRLVSHRYSERVQRAIPDALVEVWDGVGHVPQFEAPQRTNAAILAFLDRVEAGRD